MHENMKKKIQEIWNQEKCPDKNIVMTWPNSAVQLVFCCGQNSGPEIKVATFSSNEKKHKNVDKNVIFLY